MAWLLSHRLNKVEKLLLQISKSGWEAIEEEAMRISKENIKEFAYGLGMDLCGIAGVDRFGGARELT